MGCGWLVVGQEAVSLEHSLLAGHGSFGQDSFRRGSDVRGLQLLEFNVQLFQQPRTEKLFSLVSLISVLHIYLNSTNVYHSKNTNMTFQRHRRFVKTKANENVNANLYKSQEK